MPITLKKVTLYILDLNINLLTKLRNYFRINKADIKKDPSIPSITQVKHFYPYDLVTLIALNKGAVGSLPVALEAGDVFTSGVVIGYAELTPEGIPGRVKVAHMNTAEYEQPVVKFYNTEQLQLLFSPLEYLQAGLQYIDLQQQLLKEGALTQPEPFPEHSTKVKDKDKDPDKGGNNSGSGTIH